jgi:hypothetical protein
VYEADDPLAAVDYVERKFEQVTGFDLSPEFRALQAHPLFAWLYAEAEVSRDSGRLSAEYAALMDDFVYNEKAFWRHEPGY